MHISVPSSREETKVAENGEVSRYVVYDIHINGTYHCSARFSRLHDLYKMLKREFGTAAVGDFPSKTLFYVKKEDSTERRMLLQTFLQNVARVPAMVQGSTFQNFLLNAQSEVVRSADEDVQLEVLLPNGKTLHVDIVSTHQSDDVLETVCSVLGMNPDLTYYFALFLVEDSAARSVIRKLQDFECPYISLQRAEPQNRIQLRRAYWDLSCERALLDDPIALNLLYVQAITDIKNGVVVPPQPVSDRLAALRASGDKLGFLKAVRELRDYGLESFGPCVISYPEDDNKVSLFIGRGELRVLDSARREHRFVIQRMRTWRTYTSDDEVELEFEYSLEPVGEATQSKMRWVQLRTRQCIHAAMCLQFMVEEHVRLRDKIPLKRPADRVGKFKPRRQTVLSKDMAFLTSDTPLSPRSSSSSQLSASSQTRGSKSSMVVSFAELLTKVTVEKGEEQEEPEDPDPYAAKISHP